MFLPILEEAGIYMKTGFTPLDVEIKWKRDAEVTVVDLEHVGDVQLHHYLVRLAAERDVHCGVVSGSKTSV